MEWFDSLKKNSMLYWYPKIEHRVPTPRTVMIPCPWEHLHSVLEGKFDAQASKAIREAKAAAKDIGYPIFVRTDQTSNKHSWENSCFVTTDGQLLNHIERLIEFTIMVDVLTADAIVIREFLDLEWHFRSHLGMPVAREYRFFAKGGEVQCWHPYWFEEMMEFYRGEPKGWQEQLKQLQAPPDDFHLAEDMVARATDWTEELWSVDVCKTRDGRWMVTDMALGENSYHRGDCPFSTEEFRTMDERHRKRWERKRDPNAKSIFEGLI